MYHIFIQSTSEEHFGCFHVLATMNNITVNIGVHMSLQEMFSILGGRYPEQELLGHMVTLFLIFQGASILFSIVAVPVYIPTSSKRGFLFLHNLSNTCYY